VQVDLQRILAEQVGRDGFVDIRLDGANAEEGFAEADDPLVGVYLDPDDIGELFQPDGFDPGDLHLLPL